MAKQTLNKLILFLSGIVSLILFNNCGGSLGSTQETALQVVGSCTFTDVSQQTCPASALNVITVKVGGTLTGSYSNEPVVSVKICVPGSTTQCQTIDNILLDTGSYGLRLFQSAVSISLPQVQTGGNDLAECVIFGTGSTWGPVKSAAVTLGTETAVTVPVQVIDQTYYTAKVPSHSPDCVTYADSSPSQAGYNGILGLGMATYDGDYGYYYACSGSGSGASCTATSPATSLQVANPVALLGTDNNGLSIILPQIPVNGAGTVTGCMVLGIGTRTNNVPGTSVTVLGADNSNQFRTTWNGTIYSSSFIDSGSNGLYFPRTSSSLPDCGGGLSGFFCPATTQCLVATQQNAVGTTAATKTVQFGVANAQALFQSGNFNYSTLGGELDATNHAFDWGLPFFFGRTVYVGFDGKSAIINSSSKAGPFWAY